MGLTLCQARIEFMPLDSGHAWLKELVVPGREILRCLQAHFDLRRVQSKNHSETAKRSTFADGRQFDGNQWTAEELAREVVRANSVAEKPTRQGQ